jgi:hypothetical protein
MKCDYLLQTLEELFISIGGDVSWLIKGLDHVPQKLQALGKINNILAYQPWKFKLNYIEEIMKNDNVQKTWNTRELLQACLIMIFFQKISAIIEGFNLSPNEQIEKTYEMNKKNSEEEEICKEFG